MSMSLERQASLGNGLLVFAAGGMAAFEAARSCAIGLGIFMGIGLIFSGVANYCGWYRILAKMPWNQPRPS